MEVDSSSDDDWVPHREQPQKMKESSLRVLEEGKEHQKNLNKKIVKISFKEHKRKENLKQKKDEKNAIEVDENQDSEEDEKDKDDDWKPEYSQIIGVKNLKEHQDKIKKQSKMFNPCEDEENERWLKERFPSYTQNGKKKNETKLENLQNEPLNCLSCFELICLESQPHENYKNQYRAERVVNCEVNQNKMLNLNKHGENYSLDEPQEALFELKCTSCGNKVGFYDHTNKWYLLVF
ncbi:unnamed protein product [Moneuplotes crassus]|uniref:E2F-associated phosphoprotein n=1 Tax=Euplotes crassus TaxID=5936 RepID=A0AAD1XH38_EUPCR|nr:unnamed protein product [Moneuplotes crassus]